MTIKKRMHALLLSPLFILWGCASPHHYTVSEVNALQKKAQKGEGAALEALGRYYEHKSPPDYTKARMYYERALDQKRPKAAKYLGDLYHKGLGVQKNQQKALEYYQLSLHHTSSS